MMESMTKRVVLGVPTVALSAVLACTLAGCGGGANDEAKNEANDTAPAAQEAGNAPKAEPEATPEAAPEKETSIDCESFSATAADGWELVDPDKYGQEAKFYPEGSQHVLSVRTENRDIPTTLESLQSVFDDKGVVDEVETNGTTWTRFTMPDNSVRLLGASSSGRTVNVTIAWQIGWDAAVPMIENIVVK